MRARGRARLLRNYVVRLAREKAEAVASQYPKGTVLGADTTVVIEGPDTR
jgi:predicted house-cleaning NTP pyrophosphatase (Maf/HAM1 superfamily)